jgi:hypothetical protein
MSSWRRATRRSSASPPVDSRRNIDDDDDDHHDDDGHDACHHPDHRTSPTWNERGNGNNARRTKDGLRGRWGRRRTTTTISMSSSPHSILAFLLVVVVATVSFIVVVYSYHRGSSSVSSTSSHSRYGMRLLSTSVKNNATRAYLMRYESALLDDDLAAARGRDDDDDDDDVPFLPLVYDGKSILCRKKHRDAYSKYRIRYFVQMVREGMRLERERRRRRRRRRDDVDNVYPSSPLVEYDDVGMPILVMDGDYNGCNVVRRMDEYNGNVVDHPRFAWSTLNGKKHGWACRALSMPSYETWKYHHRTRRTYRDWETYFGTNEFDYPWYDKVGMAVWRGSTTYEGQQYHDAELKDMPRGRLVNIGMDNPNIIDASFHKVIQKFEHRVDEVRSEFRTGGRMGPRDMMKYRGAYTARRICLSNLPLVHSICIRATLVSYAITLTCARCYSPHRHSSSVLVSGGRCNARIHRRKNKNK